MNDLETMDNQTYKPKEKHRFRPWMICLAILLCASLLAGGGLLIWRSHSSPAGIAAPFAAITTFGLAPDTADTSELTEETIVFEESNGTNFHVSMTYCVNLSQATGFSLPYAHLGQYEDPEIMVDGQPIDFTSEKLSAEVTRPMVSQGTRQPSVRFPAASALQEAQPLDSYRLLMESCDAYGSKIHILSLDSKLKIFDLSGVSTLDETGQFYFETQGEWDSIRLLFTCGDCAYERHSNEIRDNGIITNYALRTSEAHTQRWFAVMQDSEVTVCADGKMIPCETFELRDILTQKLGVDEAAQSDYVKALNRALRESVLDGSIFVVDPNFPIEDKAPVQARPFMSLYRFDIPSGGTHEITIKLTAVGSSVSHMLEWADSPRDMWKSTGKRTLYIDLDDKPYRYLYPIPDSLIHFEEPRTGQSVNPQ